MTDKDIVFNNFQRGIGDSPYVGFGRMQNIDIFGVPGAFRMAYRSTLSFTPIGFPTAIVKDVSGNVYIGTDQGYVYQIAGTITRTLRGPSSAVSDLKVWNNYLFITANSTIDVYGPLNSVSSALFPNWLGASLATGYGHQMLPLPGNTMYIANGAYVAVLSSFAAGAIGVAPTGSLNLTAIPLPSGEFVRSLAELSRLVLIGTQFGASFSDLYTVSQANIYPYDLNTLTLGFPIAFEENGINQMFTVNNQTYVHAGIYGNIYITNGTSAQFYKNVLPGRIFGETITPFPNAMNYVNNQLLVGTAYSGSSSNALQGVYSIRNGGALNFRTISTLNTGSTQPLNIGAIYPTGQDTMLIGWQDGSTYGVDTIDFTTFGSFSSYSESEVLKVGTPLDNATYEDIEVQLTKPLIAGQQIRLKARDGINSTYKTITTLDMTNAIAGSTAIYAKASLTDYNTLQIRCELNQTASYPNNIEVMEVRLR